MANRQQLQRRADILTLQDPKNNYFGENVKLTLFPNGQKGELWVSNGREGMCIKVSDGRAGLSVQIEHFAGGPPMTVHGNLTGDLEPVVGGDFRYLSVTQYKPHATAQAFKKWMECDFRSQDMDKYPTLKPFYTRGQQAAQTNESPDGLTGEMSEEEKNAFLCGFWSTKAHPKT